MESKFVYFDLGNVLVHFDHGIAVQNLAKLVSREPERVRHALFSSGLQDRLETGLMTPLQFAQDVIESLECELTGEHLLETISAIFHPNEAIVPILNQLKRARVPMAVLSNTCEPHWQWILRQNWSVLSGWFDFYVLSYEAKSMKPDSGIYVHSEQRSGRPPELLFFTDDRADNIAAASARGWATHQFVGVEPLARELSAWLGLNIAPHDSASSAPRL